MTGQIHGSLCKIHYLPNPRFLTYDACPVTASSIIPVERIEKAIYLIRGEKVMLDRDLAQLYQVETRVLNQAV